MRIAPTLGMLGRIEEIVTQTDVTVLDGDATTRGTVFSI